MNRLNRPAYPPREPAKIAEPGKAAYLGSCSIRSLLTTTRTGWLPGEEPQVAGQGAGGSPLAQDLLNSLDTVRRDIDTRAISSGSILLSRRLEMVTDPKAQRAFDIEGTVKVRDMYGRNDLGQCCLLARRLVEAGVTYVTVQAGGGWDTHGDNFKQLKTNLLPKFDTAITALVTDLCERGLQDDVLVMAMGEFGRTPKINSGSGRDHWPGAMTIVYAGGGLKMGQAIGTTNALGEYPTSKPASPGCVLSTMAPCPGHRPQRVHRPGPAAAADPERRRAGQELIG